MQFGAWVDFCNKQCGYCDKPVIGDKPVSIVFDGDGWYHETCLLRAKRALAGAMKLARLGYAITAYCATRDNVET